ncbi:MAG: hypothetical protein V4495_10185 [Pseudomonadota bacterium]
MQLRIQLIGESESMLRYAFGRGMEIPEAIQEMADLLERTSDHNEPFNTSLIDLIKLHDQLAKLVAPAMPSTLHLLDQDATNGSWVSMFGPLPNIRRLTLASFLCTCGFVLLSMSPTVDSINVNSDIYHLSGVPLLVIICFLLTSAGMGSTFHALFQMQKYITDGTFDSRYDTTYWIRIGLGFVAGLLLAVMLPLHATADTPTIAKPVLALLGGFSSGLVFRILKRLVDTVESLFHSDMRELANKTAELQLASTKQDLLKGRLDVAEQLIDLRDQLAQGKSNEQINVSLSTLLDNLLSKSSSGVSPVSATSILGNTMTIESGKLANGAIVAQ